MIAIETRRETNITFTTKLPKAQNREMNDARVILCTANNNQREMNEFAKVYRKPHVSDEREVNKVATSTFIVFSFGFLFQCRIIDIKINGHFYWTKVGQLSTYTDVERASLSIVRDLCNRLFIK